MASGINKVIIVGRVGQDPEVRFMPNGKAVTNLSVATSESWKDQSGQKQERTEWHRCVIFDKLAEITGEYVKKGSQIYLEGKLQTKKWTDQQGIEKYTTEIVCNVMQMLGSKQDSQPSPQQQQWQQQAPQQAAQTTGVAQGQYPQSGQQQRQAAQRQPQPQYAPPPIDYDSDIPF